MNFQSVWKKPEEGGVGLDWLPVKNKIFTLAIKFFFFPARYQVLSAFIFYLQMLTGT